MLKVMKLLVWPAVLLAADAGFVRGNPEGEEDGLPLSLEAEAGFYSKYIWRGLEINSEGVFQPEVAISFLGFGAGVWGNLDLTDSLDNRGEFTEIDYILSYTLDLDFLSVGLAYLYYDYPDTDEEKTQEIGIFLEAGEELQGSLEIYYDFDGAEGAYCKPALGWRFEAGGIGLTPSIGLGWGSVKYNEYYFGERVNSLVDLEVKLAADADVYGGIYISATGAYYTLLESDLRGAVEEGKDGFWGGAALGFAF